MIHVWGAVLILISGLSLLSFGLFHKAESAQAKIDLAEQRAEIVSESLRQSEASKNALIAANKALDRTLVDQDRRRRALDSANQELAKELDAIKKSLPAEDQACLDRPLPPALALRLSDRLRLTPDGNEAGKAKGP